VGGAAVSLDDIRAEVAELLGIGAATVDPDVDLVGQGLDSIRMMTLAGRWRKQGIDIDFATLAADPTIEVWAERLAAATAPAPPPVPDPDDEPSAPFPLAPMQHAMWVGRQDNQPLGGVAGHLYVEFDGTDLDPRRLSAAAAALAARHPMLRVEFHPDGTQQIGSLDAGLPVAVNDLRDCCEADVEERLAQTREDKSHQQLDGQVFELTLTRLPGGRSRLHVDLDMQAGDAMSYRTLMADLAALYGGSALPELTYTYRDYRRQMRRRSAHDDPAHVGDQQWWAQRLPDLPDPPRLPAAAHTTSRRSTRRWHWLDPRARDALFTAARARGVTPAMALAASFAHTVASWSASPRFLLNLPLFGREQLHPEVDDLVGDFTSSLLLDVDPGRAPTATERARHVQDVMRTAATHAGYSGLSVLRDLGRHRGTQVLAPVVFTSALGLGELFAPQVTDTFGRPVWIISQGPQVLLDAQVTEFDGGVLVTWDVREEAFLPGVVDAMFAHHVAEITRLTEDEAAWDTAAPAALPAAQRAVRDAANATTAVPSGEALHDGFFRHADARPDAPAVFADCGDLTYGQLRQQALAIAAALRANGIEAGDTVAVIGPKCAEQIPAVLGVVAVGAAYLPIGADQPPDRAAQILTAGSVRAALLCGDAPEPPVAALRVAEVLGTRGGEHAEAVLPPSDPGALAYVLFTSGSTGAPKGVEVTHDAAMNTVEFFHRHFQIGPADRWLTLATLEADMSVVEIFGALCAGGAVVVVDEAQRTDPDRWVRLIETHRVTALNFMPGWLQMLLDAATDRGGAPLASLRTVAVGGDWVRPELARRLHAVAPDARFAGLGGATETAVHATICETVDPPADWVAVPYGIPLPNNACRVVDATGHDSPDWVPGELWVSGRGIARGYRGLPELTAQKFVAHQGRTWYRTGDLARYWPDGTLEFVGRADHRVKVSGYRIELGDVEAALRRVTAVTGAVAAVVEAGDSQVLAAAVSVADPARGAAQIRADLADLVPSHMVPRHVLVIDAIPFTVAGKIDRRAVSAHLTAAVATAGSPDYRAPSTPLEAALAGIFGAVLGADRIGVDDDFFALGGDSVLATAAVARVRTWLDAPEAMVADIFATRTVAALAARLSAREPDPGRLHRVAEVYLEIIGMDGAEVLDQIGSR